MDKLCQMEDSRLQKSRKFIQSQQYENNIIKTNKLNQSYYNQGQQIMRITSKKSPRRVKFNPIYQYEQNSFKNNTIDITNNNFNQSTYSRSFPKRDYLKHKQLLQSQIQIQKIQSRYDLQKSKIQDQLNNTHFFQKNPYGKENVQITQNVINKYSLNQYNNQGKMLKKFEEQAKKRKQENLQSSRRINISNTNNTYRNILQIKKRKTSILQRQKRRLQQQKKAYLLKIQQQKLLQYQQKKRLKYLQKQLKLLRQRLDINNSIINQGIHQKFRRQIQLSQQQRDHISKMQFLDKQWQHYRKKIPIIIYKDKSYDAKNYFSNLGNTVGIKQIDRKDIKTDKPQEYHEVLKIFKMNQLRMDYLIHRGKNQYEQGNNYYNYKSKNKMNRSNLY